MFTRISGWAVPGAIAAVLVAAPTGAIGSVSEASSSNPVTTAARVAQASAAQAHTNARLADVALVPNSVQAWAVGYWETAAARDKPLAYRWTGTRWVAIAAPNAGLGAYLEGVVATSKTNAWAVGTYYASTHDHRPYAVHWNGSSWKRVTAPALHGGLNDVSAVGGATPWAVGSAVTNVGGANVDSTLVLRWNGTTWKRVSAPGLGFTLKDIDAVSRSTAWAVGDNGNRAIALRWNGSAWKRVGMPGVSSPSLEGVTALRAQAWAVGSHASSWTAPQRTLMLHWRSGHGWSRVSVPTFGFAAELHSVAATSGSNVWTVGQYQTSSGDQRPLVLRWNGTRWTAIEPPGPAGHLLLNAVVASSPKRIWAVGYNYFHYNPAFYAYLVRWNGARWTWWWS